MQQPKSIERFEQLFFLGLAISLIATILNWNNSLEQLSQNPATAQLGQTVLIIPLVIGYAISLLLWFFIARRGSEVAKWIYVALFALSLLGLVSLFVHLPGAAEPSVYARVGQIAGWVLGAINVWLLFRPDTRAWFNKGVDPKL